jgi:hypothetical protein
LKSMSRSASAYFIVVLLMVVSADCSRSTSNKGERASATPENSKSASSAEPPPAPVAWDDVVKSYERVHDYTCLYEKEERAISKGELQSIHLYFRKPFDVRMEWLNEHAKVDQTAVYRQGFNGGKVLCRRSGLVGTLAGTVRLDPNDSLALEDSRHPITEAGLGSIIKSSERDAANPEITKRYLGEEMLDGRPTYKFEINAKQDGQLSGVAQSRRALIWIDKNLTLPVKVEICDRANVLLERHRFKDLRVNVGLSDKTFALITS